MGRRGKHYYLRKSADCKAQISRKLVGSVLGISHHWGAEIGDKFTFFFPLFSHNRHCGAEIDELQLFFAKKIALFVLALSRNK